jgi:hypothetical protein
MLQSFKKHNLEKWKEKKMINMCKPFNPWLIFKNQNLWNHRLGHG